MVPIQYYATWAYHVILNKKKYLEAHLNLCILKCGLNNAILFLDKKNFDPDQSLFWLAHSYSLLFSYTIIKIFCLQTGVGLD
jgi:hypothetical protein